MNETTQHQNLSMFVNPGQRIFFFSVTDRLSLFATQENVWEVVEQTFSAADGVSLSGLDARIPKPVKPTRGPEPSRKFVAVGTRRGASECLFR